MHKYITRHHFTFYVHFLACCIQMTNCGPRNIFVFINMKLYINGCYFFTRQRDTGSLSKKLGPNCINESSLFSPQHFPINVANLPNSCSQIATFTVLVLKGCSKQQATCWYRLRTANRNITTPPSICFAVESRVLLVKDSKGQKINKRTCNV
jgi:hypothetical protein